MLGPTVVGLKSIAFGLPSITVSLKGVSVGLSSVAVDLGSLAVCIPDIDVDWWRLAVGLSSVAVVSGGHAVGMLDVDVDLRGRAVSLASVDIDLDGSFAWSFSRKPLKSGNFLFVALRPLRVQSDADGAEDSVVAGCNFLGKTITSDVRGCRVEFLQVPPVSSRQSSCTVDFDLVIVVIVEFHYTLMDLSKAYDCLPPVN